jgi:hypothetical protein
MTPFSRVLIAIVALNVPSFALAQRAPTPPPGVPQAAVGHRQPTASEVPADDSVEGDKGPVGKPRGLAASSVPKLDVQATCRRAQPLSTGEKSAYQSCLDDELQAQKDLAKTWSTFKSGARSVCLQETKIGGAPSYVELLTCLELDKQAAEAAIENRKALKMPSGQSGTSGGASKPKK